MTPPELSRAEHQVRAAGENGVEHQRNLLRSLAAVRVEEHRDGGIRRQRDDAGEAGSSVPAPRLMHHAGSRIARHSRRRVGRAVVHDDHFRDDVARRSANQIADDGGLVQRGYDQDRLHPALARARTFGSHPKAPRSFTAPAIASGATSTSLAHTGIVHGSDRKKLYAKPTVPVKAINGTEGVTAKNGTSHTTYHGKTFAPSTMTPATIGTARTARLPACARDATTTIQAAVAASASSGSFTKGRTRPGLKNSPQT